MFQPSTFLSRLLKPPFRAHLCATGKTVIISFVGWAGAQKMHHCQRQQHFFEIAPTYPPKPIGIIQPFTWNRNSFLSIVASLRLKRQICLQTTGTDLGCLEGWPELVGFQSWSWCWGNQGPTNQQKKTLGVGCVLWAMAYQISWQFVSWIKGGW